MRHEISPKYIRRSLIFSILLIAVLLPLGSSAHIVAEAPWHPAPAAYRRALFYGNLKPIDWQLIAKEFETPIAESGFEGQSVYDILANADLVTGADHVTAIQAAITNEDRQALYGASTRAISQLTRYYLSEAAPKLIDPGAALEDVFKAESIYRAFGQDFLQQADSAAFQELGRAWLTLANSVGNAGVFGVSAVDANPEQFAATRQTVESYLIENYEPEVLRTARH